MLREPNFSEQFYKMRVDKYGEVGYKQYGSWELKISTATVVDVSSKHDHEINLSA